MNSNIVYLLDDDPKMLKALSRLLRTEGLEPRPFVSAQEFFSKYRPGETACLVLDVNMPEVDGLRVQERLQRDGILIPIIFLTGRGDIPMSVRAMKAGAADFLTKPVEDAALLRAVRAALLRAQESAALTARFAQLTPREREVMEHVVKGQLNKQIAADLGAAERTIKIHRSRIMEKMEVESVADLVRAGEKLGIRK